GFCLFAPERSESYEVFNTRLLSENIKQYCIEEVHFMPKLWRQYKSKMSTRWQAKVQEPTKERTTLPQTPTYNGKGSDKALGP
ncbi:hypothetical protein DL95DRAFT_232004, partial [Leptodontidium sp. 2 PMI_412]